MSKYTTLTLKLIRGYGWRAQVVEKWQGFGGVRVDLFGIIDIIATTGKNIVGVQSTSYGQRADHLDTILKSRRPETEDWIRSGGELWLISWKKERAELSEKAKKKLRSQNINRRKSLSFRYIPVIDKISLSLLHTPDNGSA